MIIIKNELLSKHTNYKIGGPARYFIEVRNVADLKEALFSYSQIKDSEKGVRPIFVISGGTNILFSDSGYDGLVIKMANSGIVDIGNNCLLIQAGTPMKDIVSYSVNHGLAGLSWAGGLPGNLSGAIRGDAGAFKKEMKDIVSLARSVRISNQDKIIERDNKSLEFDYRTSIFKSSAFDEVIIEAVLCFDSGDRETLINEAEDKINFRNSRHPLEYGSAGSVFKNVPVESFPKEIIPLVEAKIKNDPFPIVPAGFLVEFCGLSDEEKYYGGGAISIKHHNFIVNRDSASAKDILYLIDLAKRKVKEKYKVNLEEEIMIVK